MKIVELLTGGLVAGLLIVLGEFPLNMVLLASYWDAVLARLELPEPTASGWMDAADRPTLLNIVVATRKLPLIAGP